jgi:hypothetical protein
MRLVRKSSSHAAVLRLSRRESFPGALRMRLRAMCYSGCRLAKAVTLDLDLSWHLYRIAETRKLIADALAIFILRGELFCRVNGILFRSPMCIGGRHVFNNSASSSKSNQVYSSPPARG